MALFPPWSNSLFAGGLALIGATAAGALLVGWLYVRSPLNTGVDEPIAQPVVFDHRHHVADDGIDCRYCHYLVDDSPHAGVPPTSLCMNCHAQIWNNAALLEPVRASYFTDTPIVWSRVNGLPDHVFFDHSIHVNRGVGCVTCHGRVDQMASVHKAQPFTMQFCLDCHRNPEPFLRPRGAITAMDWTAPQPSLGARLAALNAIRPPTNCTGCHR